MVVSILHLHYFIEAVDLQTVISSADFHILALLSYLRLLTSTFSVIPGSHFSDAPTHLRWPACPVVPAVATAVMAPQGAWCVSHRWGRRRTRRSAEARHGSSLATRNLTGPGGWWSWMATATWVWRGRRWHLWYKHDVIIYIYIIIYT